MQGIINGRDSKMRDKEQKVIDKMFRLEQFYGTWRAKARRNLRMYEYSPTISIDSMSDDQVCGYYQQHTFDLDDDTTSSVQENVIRSCIDTLVSKIASQKVRPFFNTVNGTFKDMQVVKQAQQYFDALYDEQNVSKTVSDAFRDACIFDKGVVYIDLADRSIKRVMPWQVFVNPKEVSYGKVTQAAYKQYDYPLSLLPIKVKDKEDYETVTLWQYWDLNAGKHYYYIPELDHFESEPFTANCIPFIFINYSSPVKASSCQSVVDLLYGIQMEIDALVNKIKDASQLVAPMQYFVPEGSSIKANKISNRIGEVYTYTTTPNMTGSPVTVSTTPFMDPQWIQALDKFKQDAYELVGISQLSAMSQKPEGLDSGKALSTMEDIESDRFETQLNTVIRAYVDLSRLCIQLFPPEDDILPPNRLRNTITWADIVSMRDQMSIQFSAANSLSKDPSTKLQQLQQLYQAGLIPQSRIAQLMDLPDLQLGYSITNNSINAVLSVIDDCIEKDVYDVPDYIPVNMLMEEILNTCLSLRAGNSSENANDISKLLKLYDICMKKQVNAQTSAEVAVSQQIMAEMQNQMQPGGVISNAINQGAQKLNQADQAAASGDPDVIEQTMNEMGVQQ